MRQALDATCGAREPLSLRLLGGFGLDEGGRPVILPTNCQRVVAFLALHDQPLARAYVAGMLWPDNLQPRAAASLRSALWRLRRAALAVVEATSTELRLGTEVVVDTRRMVRQFRRLRHEPAPCNEADLDPQPLTRALLPDWHADDWLLLERERFRQMSLHGLEALCDHLRSLGRHGEALEAGLAAIRGEPLRESAHRAVIAVHLAEGNHVEALRQYHCYRRLVRRELGIAPSEQMTRLIGDLRCG